MQSAEVLRFGIWFCFYIDGCRIILGYFFTRFVCHTSAAALAFGILISRRKVVFARNVKISRSTRLKMTRLLEEWKGWEKTRKFKNTLWFVLQSWSYYDYHMICIHCCWLNNKWYHRCCFHPSWCCSYCSFIVHSFQCSFQCPSQCPFQCSFIPMFIHSIVHSFHSSFIL